MSLDVVNRFEAGFGEAERRGNFLSHARADPADNFARGT
jgi:hypothetical protein